MTAMPVRALALLALSLGALAWAAPAPFLEPRGPDTFPGLDGLQGVWTTDSEMALSAESVAGEGLLVIRGSTLTTRGRIGGPLNRYEVKLLPGGKFDITIAPGDFLGLYRLRGSVLTLRYGALNQPRPASIESKGPGYLVHLRRVGR